MERDPLEYVKIRLIKEIKSKDVFSLCFNMDLLMSLEVITLYAQTIV